MLYIGIDLGTSASKFLLVDEVGRVLNTVTKEYPLSFPRPGWSEQDPAHWWQACLAGVPELLAGFDAKQVAGIGVGGQHDSTGEPWFVAKKDLKTNTLWICQGHDHPWLLSHELICVRPSWISGHAPEPNTPVTVRTRYRQPDEPTRLAAVGAQAFTLDCTDSPQWAATPGQSAVLYQGDVCLGGGFIDVVER